MRGEIERKRDNIREEESRFERQKALGICPQRGAKVRDSNEEVNKLRGEEWEKEVLRRKLAAETPEDRAKRIAEEKAKKDEEDRSSRREKEEKRRAKMRREDDRTIERLQQRAVRAEVEAEDLIEASKETSQALGNKKNSTSK